MSYFRPTQDQIADYLNLAATRKQNGTLTVADIEYGTIHETDWSNTYSFASMITSLANTPVTAPSLWLREGEKILRVTERLPVRHCGWKRGLPEPCRLPVVQILYCWGPPSVHDRTYQSSGWRHTGGIPLHAHNDYGNLYYEPGSCGPIPLCLGCGQEYPDNHCSKCHVNDSLVTVQEGWGNRTTCNTGGCGYMDYYSIGD